MGWEPWIVPQSQVNPREMIFDSQDQPHFPARNQFPANETLDVKHQVRAVGKEVSEVYFAMEQLALVVLVLQYTPFLMVSTQLSWQILLSRSDA